MRCLAGILFCVACLLAHAGQIAVAQQEAYVVQFSEAGILDYSGNLKGFKATAPGKPDTSPDFDSAAVAAYESWLQSKRKAYLKDISVALGRELEASHVYTVLQHAVALNIGKDEAYALGKLPFIKSVWLPERQVFSMHSTPQFVGADWIWDGTSTPNNVGTQGQGVSIGVVDSGVDNRHPSFGTMGAECGYSAPVQKLVVKNCNRDGCPVGNEPLANCLGSPDGIATDCVGHGTHVAGIAAGNAVSGRSDTMSRTDPDRPFQGIAKCARIISYSVGDGNVFDPGVYPTAVMQAIEQAIRDRVQVVNMSFGPRAWAENPWGSIADSSISPLLTLGLVRAGILPVTASGNLGPSDRPVAVSGSVVHVAPWEIVVAAASGGFPTHMGWAGTVSPAMPDQMANFSLLGPARLLDGCCFRDIPGVTKPDLVAPGVNVESARRGYGDFIRSSGTSVSAPIVAGGAALLKSANPTWTPMEIASAMMLTAKNPGELASRNYCEPDDETRLCPGPWPWRQWTPDEGGSGRIALYDAGLTGFVMNETYENFLAADPAHGGNPATLNLPYVRGSGCTPTCTWTRTLRATRPEHVRWAVNVEADPGMTISVSPASFMLSSATAAEATVRLTITATRTTAPTTNPYHYGMIRFEPDMASITPPISLYTSLPTEHMTVSIKD